MGLQYPEKKINHIGIGMGRGGTGLEAVTSLTGHVCPHLRTWTIFVPSLVGAPPPLEAWVGRPNPSQKSAEVSEQQNGSSSRWARHCQRPATTCY